MTKPTRQANMHTDVIIEAFLPYVPMAMSS